MDRTALLFVAVLAGCGGGSPGGPGEDTPFSWDQSAPLDTGTTDLVPDQEISAPDLDTSAAPDTTPGLDLGPGPDTVQDCSPGTKCWADQWVIQASKVTFVVDGTAYNPDWFLLDELPPTSLLVPVEVRSTGMNPLNLVSIFLEDGGNPNISLEWTGDVQPEDLPLELMEFGESVSLAIRYEAPAGSTEGGPAFLTAWSGDPDHPSRSLKFAVKQPGPDLDASLTWGNYGCDVYCMGSPFELFNSGTEPLVIQSASFVKPSTEWSVEPAIPPGLTLVPAGQAGITTFPFEAYYCDGDGSLGADSNTLQIFSNDPDENPLGITLTVQPPDECP